MNTKQNNNGSVQISESVISAVAEAAAMNVSGVARLARVIDGPGWAQFTQGLGAVAGRPINGGIKVQTENDVVTIDMSLVVLYGYLLPIVAKMVQVGVVTAVESMTGLKVAAVNIRIADILFERRETGTDAE